MPKKEPRADRLEHRPIGELHPHPHNTRTHSAAQIEMLRDSLRQYGWTRPIMVVDDIKGLPQGTIFVGHGFWEAAKAEGFTHAKVLVAEHWSPAQVRAYMIADNQLPLLAAWNEDALRRELSALAQEGITPAQAGFTADAYERLMGEIVNGANAADTEWNGMPEFDQDDESAFRTIKVHFPDQAAVDAFAEAVGQRIGPKVRAIWHPPAERVSYADKQYTTAPE